MPGYRCRTCGTANLDLYVTCNHPMCPDGRDQGIRPHQMAHNQSPPPAVVVYRTNPWTIINTALGIAALALAAGFWIFGR